MAIILRKSSLNVAIYKVYLFFAVVVTDSVNAFNLVCMASGKGEPNDL